MNLTQAVVSVVVLVAACVAPALADDLEPGVRGVATRAPQGMKIDGDLSEFKDAFCTPVCYFEENLKNRAGQFFYMWDDEAFYAGLRTLDEKMANNADDGHLWEGDGVEWYFDTRRGDAFRDAKWGAGAVHMYWTGFKGKDLEPRWCLRPDMLQAIPGTGVEVGSRKTGYGSETEFKLPWANFPDFKPEKNAVIALDAELCYSDGGPRVYRTFAYGSPLSVQQPASQAKVQLVDALERKHWKQCGPVMMPVRCDTPWGQETKGQVTAYMVVPPNHADLVHKYIFRLMDLNGRAITDYEGKIETINPDGNFKRATVRWPIDVAAPGAFHLVGMAIDKEGKELARVAPRMVSVHMNPGY
jgi:hypothetical protein